MGTSRTPVREALIELANEGLVVIEPQRGFRLRVIDSDEREEIFKLRELLEVFVVKQLAETISENDIAQLRRIINEQSNYVTDPNRFLQIDEEFHILMPRLAGLKRTHKIMSSLRGAMWLLGTAALVSPERASNVLKEHQSILDAIEAHDVEAAASAMKVHLRITSDVLDQQESPRE